MCQCPVGLGLGFDVFHLFAMHFNLLCAIKRNYMSRYLGDKSYELAVRIL